jgi:hypothetical protein
LTVTAVFVFAFAALAADVKTDIPGMGPDKQLLVKAEPTTAGTFDGTWMYVNRDARWALWIRTKDGVPQVKMQFQSLASPEAFETDWNGKSLYYLAGNPVNFELKLGKCNARQLQGSWAWALEIDKQVRREKADVVVYRTVYGRTLLMDFQNYEQIVTRNGRDTTMRVPFSWTFSKISQRELLWDELPF